MAANAGRISVEDFLRPDALDRPDLSPDGKRVAMLVRDGWDARFAIVNLAGGRPVLLEGARDEWPAWIEWKTDDRLIFSVHQEHDDQLYNSGALYAINADGTKPRALVDSLERQIRKQSGQMVNATILDYLHDDPDHLLVEADRYFLDARHRLQPARRPAVHRINIRSGAWRRVEEPFAKVTGWTADGSGNVRLAWSAENDRMVIHHRPVSGASWSELASVKIGGRSLTPAGFDPDGKRLYVFDDDGRKTAALRVLDLATGQLGPYLFALDEYDLGDTVFGGGYGVLRFDRRTKTFAGLFALADKPRFFPADESARKLQARIDQALPETVNRWVSTSRDGQRVCMKSSRELWAFGGEEGQGAGEIVVAHQALEVGERLLVRLGLPESPVHEETDCQAPEQTEEQQPVAAADTAPVVVERHIQALVASVLDPPTTAVGQEPLRRRQLLRFQIRDQPDLLVLPALPLPENPGCLGGERKADVLGRHSTADQGADLTLAPVPLDRPDFGATPGGRGKNPP